MKDKIKEYFGELPSCFSIDRTYIVDTTDDLDAGWTYGDNDTEHYILLNGCAFLNGGSWEIVNE